MDLSLFVRGIAIGFSIAAPVGPIGLLCIRRTVAGGRVLGFVTGLGAAAADAIYGATAAFGLTAVSRLFVSHQGWLRLVGGAFLCYLGARTFVAKPAEQPVSVGAAGLLGAFGSTLLLTLTNPLTILSFAAIFAGLGAAAPGADATAAGVLVAGVFIGSAAWWLVLSGVVGAFHGQLPPAALQWINRLSGAIIAGFGLIALLAARG